MNVEATLTECINCGSITLCAEIALITLCQRCLERALSAIEKADEAR